MNKEDYLEFIKIHVGEDCETSDGSYSLWVCNPKDKYGYKIFFKDWGGPCNFLVSKKLNEIRQLQSNLGYNLLEKDKLKDYFKFNKKLFNLGLIPEPLEIFNYKSFYGIRYMNTPEVTSNELWEDRYNTLLPLYCKIWEEDYCKWLLKNDQRSNFGQINNKLLLIDIDWGGFDKNTINT